MSASIKCFRKQILIENIIEQFNDPGIFSKIQYLRIIQCDEGERVVRRDHNICWKDGSIEADHVFGFALALVLKVSVSSHLSGI